MKKALKIIGIVFLAFIAILILIPIVFKGKIMEMVKQAANDNINAVVNFEDVNISLIRNFPNLTVTVEGLSIINNAPFEGENLATVDNFRATVDIMSVISGDQIEIKGITVDEAKIRVIVLEDGTANYDIALETEETPEEVPSDTSSSFEISLQKYQINDSYIYYEDRSLQMLMDIRDLDHKGSGDFTQDIFNLETETEIEEVDFFFEGTKYLNKVKADIDLGLGINMPEMKFTFEKGRIVLNRLALLADGWLAMPGEDIDMDINFGVEENDLRALISLIPAEFAEDIEDVKTTGDFTLSGFVKGTYNEQQMPGFSVNMGVTDGTFQYPDLPRKAQNIQIAAAIENPQGSDMNNMKVDVDKFYLELGQGDNAANFIDARLKLRTPMTDPDIDSYIKADMDLGSFQDLIPFEEGETITGILKADVQLKGRLSAIENEQYDQFLAAGNASLRSFSYVAADMEAYIDETLLDFSPQRLNLESLKARMEGSQFAANGYLANYLGYALKDSTLIGRLNFNADVIDLNQFMEEDAEETTEESDTTSSTGTLEIPANIDFELSSIIGKLIYDNIEISDVKGKITLKNQVASLENLQMKTLGGDVAMQGSYDARNPVAPAFDFSYDVKNIDVTQVVTTFNSVEQIAPIVKNLTGRVNSTFNLKALMDANMNPVMDSFNGGGTIVTRDIYMEGIESLNKLASTLGISRLAKQKIEDTRVKFTLRDGKAFIDPFDVKLGNINTNVSGSTSFEQDLDFLLKMKIPRAAFGTGAAQAAESLLGKANELLGSNFSVGDMVNVDVKVTGKADDPVFTPSIGGVDMGKDLKQTVKDEVKEAVNEKIDEGKEKVREEARKRADEIMEQARQQADKLREEAKSLADKTREESNKQAQRLLDEAKNPLAKAGAKVAADKIRKEGENAAIKIEEEADQKANQIIDGAQKKADELLKED